MFTSNNNPPHHPHTQKRKKKFKEDKVRKIALNHKGDYYVMNSSVCIWIIYKVYL